MSDTLSHNDGLAQRKLRVEGLSPLREVIAAHGLCAQKSLGQNFLLDMNITDKIVREAIARDGGSWRGVGAFEVGPGPGGLTRSLLKSDVQHVTAIELDKRAAEVLGSLIVASGGDMSLIEGDALDVRISEIGDVPRVIVANLPYNIATILLLGWLKDIRKDSGSYKSLSLMFQKEVADRICAFPGGKHYGRLSVMAQWLCDVEGLYELPASAFTPAPKVKSKVVYFRPKILKRDAPSFEAVEKVTASAFNQRRKMIRSSLKSYMGAIEALGIDPTKRAENLSIDEFLAIAAFRYDDTI